MATYAVQSPPHAGASFALTQPSGLATDSAPTGAGLALVIVNGATSSQVTLPLPTYDGLVVTSRAVTIAASQMTVIPLPASVYGTGTVSLTFTNLTTLTGGATGVAVVTFPGS